MGAPAASVGLRPFEALLVGAWALSQALLLPAAALGRISQPALLWGEFAASTVMALVAALWLWTERGRSLVLFAILVAAFGPAGVIGWCVVEAACRLSLVRFPPSLSEGIRLTASRTQRPRTLHQLLLLRGPEPSRSSTVAPFADILEFGTFEQRRSVVTLITDHFRPEFSAALRTALSNSEPAIRVQAATAAARIENQFLQRSVELEALQEKGSDNVGYKIAELRDSYAQLGLWDPERAASERRAALAVYLKVLESRPQDADLAGRLARLYLQLDRPRDALFVLRRALHRGASPKSLAETLAEALYRTGRFDELRRLAGNVDFTQLCASNSKSGEALRFWAKAHAQ